MNPASLVIATWICSLEVCSSITPPWSVLLNTSCYVAAKYSHAAVWPLKPGHDLPDGKRNYPLAAMVANLAKPTPDRPALMRHDDVVTFFHEMGHVFHGLLSRTKFARFHGTRWVCSAEWEPCVEIKLQRGEGLRRGSFSDVGELVQYRFVFLGYFASWRLCCELGAGNQRFWSRCQVIMRSRSLCQPSWLRKLWKGMLWVSYIVAASFDVVCGDTFSWYVNVGLFYLRQLFFAKFDIKVHTDQGEQFIQLLGVLFNESYVCSWRLDGEDYTVLWNTLRESISLVKSPKKFGPGQATFAHITGGYDAGYYGCAYPVTCWLIVTYILQFRYTYSLVFAADMYATVFKKDPLNPALGQRYRERILRVGGSREETESLEVLLAIY